LVADYINPNMVKTFKEMNVQFVVNPDDHQCGYCFLKPTSSKKILFNLAIGKTKV